MDTSSTLGTLTPDTTIGEVLAGNRDGCLDWLRKVIDDDPTGWETALYAVADLVDLGPGYHLLPDSWTGRAEAWDLDVVTNLVLLARIGLDAAWVLDFQIIKQAVEGDVPHVAITLTAANMARAGAKYAKHALAELIYRLDANDRIEVAGLACGAMLNLGINAIELYQYADLAVSRSGEPNR